MLSSGIGNKTQNDSLSILGEQTSSWAYKMEYTEDSCLMQILGLTMLCKIRVSGTVGGPLLT